MYDFNQMSSHHSLGHMGHGKIRAGEGRPWLSTTGDSNPRDHTAPNIANKPKFGLQPAAIEQSLLPIFELDE